MVYPNITFIAFSMTNRRQDNSTLAWMSAMLSARNFSSCLCVTARSESGGLPVTKIVRRSAWHQFTKQLIYPSIALPSIIENIFFPSSSSPWPFGYQVIFTTAFAKAPRQDSNFCQVSFDPSVVIGRISNEVTLAADQSQLLQRLGGALGAASGYLAKY
jgi:hypothetical protein